MRKRRKIAGFLAALGLLSLSTMTASAQDTLKVAVGQRGNWDTSVTEIGVRGGIFKKYGLSPEILYTQGSGETQQAVISGSADVGVAAGTLGVLGAFAKGAPVRILGAEATGAPDLFWYVTANSPIKSLQDFDGKTVAYSTNGSSTHGVVTAFADEYGLRMTLVASGGPEATLAKVMAGTIDVGWSAPPFGVELLDQNKIRIVASGSDTSAFGTSTVRLLITNAATLTSRRDVLVRYMKAYRETVDWMYADPAALKAYVEFINVSEAVAKRTRDGFFPKSALDPDRISDLATTMMGAVNLKFIPAPLTTSQLDQLIQIPPR